MADKNEETAKFVIAQIGGENNVDSLVHCATRLRFQLKDESLVDEAALKNNPNILTAQSKSGQYQVVIGNNVSKVYDAIMNQTTIDGNGTTEADPTETNADKERDKKDKNPVSKVFEYISGTFSPLIPALAGSGMIKALLALLSLFSWFDPESSTAMVLTAASNGLFYFFPIFIGISAARFLKVSPYVGGIIGAGLLDPSFTGLLNTSGSLDFMGIPLLVSDYASTVFPMLVAMVFYAPLEKFLKKHIPDTVQLFLVPMLGIMIMVPLTALAFGPFSQFLSGIIADGLVALLNFSSVLTGIVMAVAWPFLVIMGVHWGITPIQLDNLTRGGDPLNAMAAGATFSQIGIAFGVFLRYRKNENLRSLSIAATTSGLLAGVTEPIIYGLILQYRRLMYIMMISSAVGGGLIGLLDIKMVSYAFNSLLTIPAYAPIIPYIIAIAVSFGLAAILTYMFGIGEVVAVDAGESSEVDAEPIAESASVTENVHQLPIATGESFIVSAPLEGQLVNLNDVPDPVFGGGAMGQGIAINPSQGKVYAPFDGEVTLLFPTKHAIGLTADNGVEVLIHVGMDTVELDGKYFTAHVETNQTVKKGDLLVEFDMAGITGEDYSLITPVVITNTPDFASVIGVEPGRVKNTDTIINITK